MTSWPDQDKNVEIEKENWKKDIEIGSGWSFLPNFVFYMFSDFCCYARAFVTNEKKNLLHAIARLKSEKQINYPLTSTKSLVGFAPCVVVAKAEWWRIKIYNVYRQKEQV